MKLAARAESSLVSHHHIKLPMSVLNAAEISGLRYPLIFLVDDKHFCSVKDFTDTEGVVDVHPSLGYGPERVLKVESVQLVQANHVKFRIEDVFWNQIPEIEKHALLEYQVRNYLFLQTGMEVQLVYLNRTFTFVVEEMFPCSPGLIQNCDLSTEIVCVHTDELPLGVEEISVGFERRLEFTSLSPQVFKLENPEQKELTISCFAQSGDCSMYVVRGHHSEPWQGDFDFCSQNSIAEGKLTISAGDGCQCAISIVPHDSTTVCTFQVAAAADNDSAVSRPNACELSYPQCPNCTREIRGNLDMHMMQCHRFVWFCQECQVPVRANAVKKHQVLAHALFSCRGCGDALVQKDMVMHSRTACPNRHATCGFCPMRLLGSDLDGHEMNCGSRQTFCRICSASLIRRGLGEHMRAVHGREVEMVDYTS